MYESSQLKRLNCWGRLIRKWREENKISLYKMSVGTNIKSGDLTDFEFGRKTPTEEQKVGINNFVIGVFREQGKNYHNASLAAEALMRGLEG